MIRVHVICEGQTEEAFTKELLSPYFISKGIALSPSLIGKPGHKGGNVKFERLYKDIRNRLRGDREAYCTTFFDFYGLDTAFPGKAAAENKKRIKDKADCINRNLNQSLEEKLGANLLHRFIPYVQMYEFEALLFSDSAKLSKGIGQPNLMEQFQTIRDKFASPEEINNSPMTAPSKRISGIIKGYEKPLHGVLAAKAIELPKIRQECKLFNGWLITLESLKRI